MLQLISLLFIITLIYFVQEKCPVLAGIIAIIPIKIISTIIFTKHDSKALLDATEGMLAGQFIVGFLLLGFYIYMKGGL